MSDLTEGSATANHEFPTSLLEWAGQHRGVRKPFYAPSGRPCNVVIDTPLLDRLRNWVSDVLSQPSAPRSVLLVGGPGNGKSEAVEDILRTLDGRLGLGGDLTAKFTALFSGVGGHPIPRLAVVSLEGVTRASDILEVCIVQDASVTDPSRQSQSPAELLVRDLDSLVAKGSPRIYVACINRGVLDDALTFATERGHRQAGELLEAVIRSVGLNPAAPACWPLQGFEHVTVWPMDVETLIWKTSESVTVTSPAEQLLLKAVDASKWPASGSCVAGDHCPFCRSRELLDKESQRQALLQILRWYELATGKRWSFRDLFSLVSYLLAGATQQDGAKPMSPCEWAAHLHDLSLRPPTARGESLRLRAPFMLAGSLYQHALFSSWPRLHGRGLRAEIRELELQNDPGLMGFHYFLSAPRDASIPATLKPQLQGISEFLDPSVAEPASRIELSTRDLVFGRDIDARFSQSVGEGLGQVRRWLTVLEVDLLERLEHSDDLLSSSAVCRRRPAVARRMQNLIRDFACRLVRRSLGVRHGITRERDMLADFENVVSGNTQLLHKAVKQVEALINDGDHFVVVLNSTFGEPLVPMPRRATIRTTKQRVKPVEAPALGRPVPAVRFLSIGGKGHPLALTYELFRSVRELEAGMLPASLPRPVVALLDTTRARLSGVVVRDEEILDGAEIRIGTRDTVVSRELGEFVVLKEAQI